MGSGWGCELYLQKAAGIENAPLLDRGRGETPDSVTNCFTCQPCEQSVPFGTIARPFEFKTSQLLDGLGWLCSCR